jgi:cell division FtsZ-interacting protein ZapD
VFYIQARGSLTTAGAIDDAGFFESQCMDVRSFDLACDINDNLLPQISTAQRRVANRQYQGTRA